METYIHTNSRSRRSQSNYHFLLLRECLATMDYEDAKKICAHKIPHIEQMMRKGLYEEGRDYEARQFNGTTFDHVVCNPQHPLYRCVGCCGLNNDCNGYKPINERRHFSEYLETVYQVIGKFSEIIEEQGL